MSNQNENQTDQSISEYYYLSSTNSRFSPSSNLAKLATSSSSSSKRIKKHVAYKKDGSITEYGLSTGQIQVCPSYPKHHVYLCRESGILTVIGWDAQENKVFRTFSKLPNAIAYLSRF